MMPLAVLMNRNISAIDADKTAIDVATQMASQKVGAILVKNGSDFVGIVSETDLVRRGLAQGMDLTTTTAQTLMSAPLVTIDVGQTLVDANEIMSRENIRHLVVTDRGEVTGVISVRDLVIYFKNRL